MNRNISQTWTEVGMVVHAVNRRCGRPVGDRGEGVISTAIAVLIMAFIGAAMWASFDRIWGQTEANIESEVGRIGAGAG